MVIGKVAKCRQGMTGLVLIVRKNGSTRGEPLYQGVCLDPGRVGQAWQSLHPEWIGTIDDWVKLRYNELTGPHGYQASF